MYSKWVRPTSPHMLAFEAGQSISSLALRTQLPLFQQKKVDLIHLTSGQLSSSPQFILEQLIQKEGDRISACFSSCTLSCLSSIMQHFQAFVVIKVLLVFF